MDNILKNKNLKVTLSRIKVLEAIKVLKEDATFNNILKMCNSFDRSTIYRIIEIFIENNIIKKSISDNEVIYEFCNEHKHHINCVKCHKKVEVKICPFNCEEVEGFKVLNHSLNIEGICNNCQKNI